MNEALRLMQGSRENPQCFETFWKLPQPFKTCRQPIPERLGLKSDNLMKATDICTIKLQVTHIYMHYMKRLKDVKIYQNKYMLHTTY